MCGIVGFAGFEDEALLREMTACLLHRGPDEEGFLSEEGVGLGHRRLSILDLEHGQQPMTESSGRATVVFNGQIYNHAEIRAGVLREYPFRTHCDTEVLCPLYLKKGEALVEDLRGMFAFAIWDREKRELLLARDRIGVKPLYYSHLPDGSLLFASELKALLAHPRISKQVDWIALEAYLRLLYVPPPFSIFRDIRQLPPGHTLRWREGRIELDRYWEPVPGPLLGTSPEERAEIVAPVVEEAIRMRTLSDVPLGAFLSGGIDSSTIVAVLAENSSRPVETFCIGFGEEGRSYEERPIARRVADFFGTHHHEMEIHLNLVETLEEMVRGFDEPFGNPTAMLTYELARFTRRHVTVALAGDGGDEVFGGYPRYRGLLLSETLSRVPAPIRHRVARSVGARESSTARNWRRWARECLEGCDLPPALRYESWVEYARTEEIDRLLSRAMRAHLKPEDRFFPIRDLFSSPAEGDLVHRAMVADLQGFLPENVLHYSDRMSMAHSLEVRVPFTDHVLIEHLLRVPTQENLDWTASKKLLKRIMKDRLPEEVLTRKKLGFNPPMGIWLQDDRANLMNTWLSPERIEKRGWFDPQEIRRLREEHQNHRRDHGLRLWSLIVLEVWCELYGID
jgi:asparagine synthase (glutamine-hydrolysing)